MQGPAGASPGARAAGAGGQRQGRDGAGGRVSHPNSQQGRKRWSSWRQLDGLCPCHRAQFQERSRMVPQGHCWHQDLEPGGAKAVWAGHPCGWDVDGRGISTRGDCVIACGALCCQPALTPCASPPSSTPGYPSPVRCPLHRLPGPGDAPGGTEGQLQAPGKSDNH